MQENRSKKYPGDIINTVQHTNLALIANYYCMCFTISLYSSNSRSMSFTLLS
jgi:hypothetical protein